MYKTEYMALGMRNNVAHGHFYDLKSIVMILLKGKCLGTAFQHSMQCEFVFKCFLYPDLFIVYFDAVSLLQVLWFVPTSNKMLVDGLVTLNYN